MKQDRQGARTISQLVQQYSFGKQYSAMMGAANSAQRAANQANETAQHLNEALTQDGIFNILTKNGQAQGLCKDSEGNVFAAMLISETPIDSTLVKGIYVKDSTLYGVIRDSSSEEPGTVIWGLEFDQSGVRISDLPFETASGVPISIWSTGGLTLGFDYMALNLVGAISIDGKSVSWQDNGDGTFTLIGTEG